MTTPALLPPLSSTVDASGILIRSFDSSRDASWATQLWHKSFDRKWSLHESELEKRLAAATSTLVAEQHGLPVGLCTVGYQEAEPAGLLLIMVEPSFRRLGIGRKLVKHVEKHLLAEGVRQLNLGFGSAGGFFWPGVPLDQLSAWSFFLRNGWTETHRDFDLCCDLRHYGTPSWVYSRMVGAGVKLSLAKAKDAIKIIHFETSHFPAWATFFIETVHEAKYRNILLAHTQEGKIVGSLLLEAEQPSLWSKEIGERCGSLSVLGVAADQRGKGIGIALAARAMEIIQQRGGTGCYIQWTGLTNWYGKLGAQVWSEYRMSSKQLL